MLEIIQEVEWDLGRDLTDDEFKRLESYLKDDPMDTSAEYLIDLFGLH